MTSLTAGRSTQATNEPARGKKASAKSSQPSPRAQAGETQSELMRMALRACLIARDATFNVQDLLTNSSRMAFLAVRDCEKELDRIGDLVMGVAQRVQARSGQLPAPDVRYLIQMAAVLHDMLDDIHRGFVSLDIENARKVLRMDAELDRICHAVFQRHLADNSREKDSLGFDVLLMAQALERSGDHAKNLAEELYGLIEGHTLRHLPKRVVAP